MGRRRSEAVTLGDVAKRAGVSIATASKAINDRGEVAAATRARVLRAAAELSFQPNVLAQALVAGRTRAIGLLTDEFDGRFAIPILLGAENALSNQEMSVLLCDTRGDVIRRNHYIRTLLARQVDGFIVVGDSNDVRTSLTADLPVPVDRPAEAIGTGVPGTYVQARNTVIISLALAWAEVLGARDIFIGANAVDYSGYPDCRPVFLDAFERLAALATAAGTERGERFVVHAPLLLLSKREIVELGTGLGVDFSLTRTCYAPDPGGAACGRCDACILRLRGFADAGLRDPAPYRS